MTRIQPFDYFAHEADIGIVGKGDTLEHAFEAAAQALFAIMADPTLLQPLDRITLSFTESEPKFALVTWLNSLLAEARCHKLILCKFTLTREDDLWQGGVAFCGWGELRELFVHRKGATRAFGAGHSALPEAYRKIGQPVVIGGSMGTGSYILAGNVDNSAFSSACHGAGRSMSRHQALKLWRGDVLVRELAERGILIRSGSMRGVAEEAPLAYKDVDVVAGCTEKGGLARRVAFLRPKICVKG